MTYLDDVMATERDFADLAHALGRFRQMFEGEPSNLAQIHLSRTLADVVMHTENLLFIQALAYKVWIENDRNKLPNNVALEIEQWTQRLRNEE